MVSGVGPLQGCYNGDREEVQSEDFLETVKAGQGLQREFWRQGPKGSGDTWGDWSCYNPGNLGEFGL